MENVYKDWEKVVIDKFYKRSKSVTLILPKASAPLYACKNKVILVINFIENNIPYSTKVEQLNKSNSKALLPEKHYIDLYHIGEGKINKTSLGLETNTFFYPAIDVGGLTNYKHIINTKADFLEKKYLIDKTGATNATSTTLVNKIYKTWKMYANKRRFYGNVKSGLRKVLDSIQNTCYIQFVKVPIEYRVIAAQHDVFNTTGIYYRRDYGGKNYAIEVKPTRNMYCAIGEKNITPDINKNNILNEYDLVC
jgi:hypothetical protein